LATLYNSFLGLLPKHKSQNLSLPVLRRSCKIWVFVAPPSVLRYPVSGFPEGQRKVSKLINNK